MRLSRNLLLASLMVVLCGCRPGMPEKYAGMAAQWQLAENAGCFMCHTTGKNLLGPSWENVADRYRDNPDAEAHLMDRILNGSRGAWVDRAMPGYKEDLLSTENRKVLVKFIMELHAS